jgi:hypothetical protein
MHGVGYSFVLSVIFSTLAALRIRKELYFCCAWILKLLVMKKDDAKLWL